MNNIDISIIAVYIILTISLGIWVSKKASKGLDSYFLGGKSIKWYYLGLSNGSGMFDVSGTAWMVGILFLYGVKSFMFYVALAYLESNIRNDVFSRLDSKVKYNDRIRMDFNTVWRQKSR